MGAPLPSLEIRNGVCTRCGETKPPHYVPATTGKPLYLRCEIARVDRIIAWQATMIAFCGTVAIIGFILLAALEAGIVLSERWDAFKASHMKIIKQGTPPPPMTLTGVCRNCNTEAEAEETELTELGHGIYKATCPVCGFDAMLFRVPLPAVVPEKPIEIRTGAYDPKDRDHQ